jgi:PhnB protein
MICSPMLSVEGGAQADEFYKDAFRAEVLFRLQDGGGSVVAELCVGQSRFWVADEPPQHLNFSADRWRGATTRMVLVVDDSDSVFQRAV